MDKSPPPLSLAAALALPLPEGRRSAEVFVDGDLEIRLYAPKGHDPQTPHDRDELYVVARGAGSSASATGVDVHSRRARCSYVAAHETHRFEDFSDDFATWVVFYGPVKLAPPESVRRFADFARRGPRAAASGGPRSPPKSFAPATSRSDLPLPARPACRCRTIATRSTSSPPGTGRYRVDDAEVSFAPGGLLFAAARAPHGFVERSDDFAEWIVFYGPRK